MSYYKRMADQIHVGRYYKNGSQYPSTYKVLGIAPGEALLCRPSDGWTLIAHGPALYQTDTGVQLIWDYSTHGRFVEANRRVSEHPQAVR